jgi:hypothetical protein
MLAVGWVGLVILVVWCGLATYTGIILSRCWTMVQDRHAEYRDQVRNPYPVLGQITYGKWGRYTSSPITVH